jgi:two-component system response regulator PilR (NtrC family)
VFAVSNQELSNDELRTIFGQLGFVTASTSIDPLLRQASKAASVSDVTVLLEGETGTGKRILAHAIHKLDGKRKAYPFITAHCSTITEALAESELFGHHRGAFTGAVADRPGLFQAAEGGTLLLDDVNDLPLCIQPKLLDVIQRGVVRAVGSDREMPVNVRIIAACNEPLRPLVKLNRFRADLYYRLNVIRLCLPPLRERPDDLADLILEFAARHQSVYRPVSRVEPELIRLLQSQPFAGNVRELENSVLRMLFSKTQGTSLGMADWMAQAAESKPDQTRDSIAEAANQMLSAIDGGGLSFAEAMNRLEKTILEIALNGSRRTRRETARRLRTSERTLYHKMRAHDLGTASSETAGASAVNARNLRRQA